MMGNCMQDELRAVVKPLLLNLHLGSMTQAWV